MTCGCVFDCHVSHLLCSITCFSARMAEEARNRVWGLVPYYSQNPYNAPRPLGQDQLAYERANAEVLMAMGNDQTATNWLNGDGDLHLSGLRQEMVQEHMLYTHNRLEKATVVWALMNMKQESLLNAVSKLNRKHRTIMIMDDPHDNNHGFGVLSD